MSTQQASTFLEWKGPGDSLIIRLDHDVIQRVNTEAMRGFGVTRRRGTETGGLLLGTIDRRAVPPVLHIQNLEVIPCEYGSGPSYVLSPKEREGFAKAVTRWAPSLERPLYTVGYFRSHTREGFTLDENDTGLFREFFHDPLDVALMVKPFATRPAMGGFVLQHAGQLATAPSPPEFTFEARSTPEPEMGVQPPTIAPVARAPVAPTAMAAPKQPLAAAAPSPQPLAFPFTGERRIADRRIPIFTDDRPLFANHAPKPSVWPRRLSWLAFTAALVAFGGVCGYEYALSLQENPALSPAGAAKAPSRENLLSMGLQVTEGDGILRVRWDRTSRPVQSALHGILTITEGSQSKEVKLGYAELRNGTALYPNIGNQVRFRLELFFKEDRSFAETADFKQAPR